ncbi:MAG: bifunctional hydroxymethylpyrimidine kinase/phosphomethylpyrimidine kinase [Alphaproteobacteria bacterium CG11_big_fil_rev_8_21_14_0_20_39_49]|nr:MAG: bifunctional hydroxymethylpyrimidine kinase/phosphomethylpyrimidine kinase [Alphaproteobacteria bacterium CG11_big_fil_rev_8_21_14_0_20_39_49]
MQGRVLIIAGSDSGGGAGIQADIKTVTMLGGYAMTAITAITAQNTQGVLGVVGVDSVFVKKQIDAVLSDIGADAIKTGMLYSAGNAEVVAEVARLYPQIPLVVDPVMVATSGDSLLDSRKAVDIMKEKIIPKAAIVTPNIPEAEILTGRRIDNTDDMDFAAQRIISMGAKSALIKGGHSNSRYISDVFRTKYGDKHVFTTDRIYTKNTHGTGCTLASAIACGIAKGKTIKFSVASAKDYLTEAIKSAEGLGRGQGPLKHNFMLDGVFSDY